MRVSSQHSAFSAEHSAGGAHSVRCSVQRAGQVRVSSGRDPCRSIWWRSSMWLGREGRMETAIIEALPSNRAGRGEGAKRERRCWCSCCCLRKAGTSVELSAVTLEAQVLARVFEARVRSVYSQEKAVPPSPYSSLPHPTRSCPATQTEHVSPTCDDSLSYCAFDK